MCPGPPLITQSAKANGACLFNSFSMLLAGRDTYSAIIHHVVYNYISNPVKYKWLQAYILPKFKSGKDYIVASNMHNFTAWGTEVEIIALAQISGFDIYVYTMNGDWLHYGHNIDNGDDENQNVPSLLVMNLGVTLIPFLLHEHWHQTTRHITTVTGIIINKSCEK